MEPERPIEKLLRAFAKKRREQAADCLQLDSVARRRLQGQIARRSAGTSTGGNAWMTRLFLLLRPRLAFAICFITVAVAVWVLIPKDREKSKTLASSSFSRSESAAKTISPPTQPSRALAGDQKAREEIAPVAASPTVPALAPAPAPVANPVPSADGLDKGFVANNRPAVASTPPAATARDRSLTAKTESVPTGQSFAIGGTLKKDTTADSLSTFASPGNNFATNSLSLGVITDALQKALPATSPIVSQSFYRIAAPTALRRIAATNPPPASVLTTFRMEQNGSALRVIDSDGSIYTGAVQIAQMEPAASPTSNFFFRVTGTNRNLKQNIVFSGNLVPFTNTAIAVRRGSFAGGIGGGGGGGGAAPSSANFGLPTGLLLSNSQISGTAVIDGQKEIPVSANPTP